MPISAGRPGRRPRTRLSSLALGGVFVVALIALLVVRLFVTLWTDYLWASDLGVADTWGRVLSAKLTLASAATVLVFAVVSVSLLFVERFAPIDVVFSRRDPLIAVRAFAAQHPNVTRNSLAAVCALLVGPAASGAWQEWTLFRTGHDSSRPTFALFGKSLGFYLFRLPLLRSASAWAFGVLVLVLVVTLLAVFLSGAIRTEDGVVVVTTEARRHLSTLLALVFLVRAVGFWYARFALALSKHEHFDGANYVDLKVRAPAFLVMAFISALCSLLLIWNIRLGSWQMPIAIVVAWIGLAIVLLGLVPAIWQRVALSNEGVKERASIVRTIGATRAAFELDRVESRQMDIEDKPVGPVRELADAVQTLRNIRLWDVGEDAAPAAFNTLQKGYQNFQITTVDADREATATGVRPRLIAVREFASTGQNPTWVNRRLTYTHGFGVVTSDAGSSVDGEPKFAAKNLPPVGEPGLTQPRVYFGEETRGYVVVDTKAKEVDFGGSANLAAPAYSGRGGIKVGSLPRRLAFAIRFGDLNLLLSNSVEARSRILWSRTVRERAARIAPFLRFDSDPLPVVFKGRILWVLEGYTVSGSYPNSDRASAAGGLSTTGGTVSYARNSVRVVVDAYTGETSFFRNPTEDPIVDAYETAYPKLFAVQSIDEKFPGLRATARYPRDLFGVRAALWGRFHTTDPGAFYSDSDRWTVGTSAAGVQREPSSAAGAGQLAPVKVFAPTPVEYVVSDPGGTGSQVFVAQQVLVNRTDRPEAQRLRGIVIATSDPKTYGHLTVLQPPGQTFDSPSSAGADLSSTPEISERETNLGRGGSEVISGEVQMVRIGRALLYVRPLYVRGESTKNPLLRFVEIRFRGRTGFAPTLAEALTQVVDDPSSVPSLDRSLPTSASPGPPTTTPSTASAATVPELLASASVAYRDAQTALAKGDLGTYQSKVDELGRAVARADELARAAAGTLTVSTVTTSPAR